MIVLGIDPGQSGGLCLLSKDEVLELDVMPTIGNEIDTHKLASMISDYKSNYGIYSVTLEKAGCRPGQSAQSGLKTGRNYGIVEGILAALSVSYQEVAPQTWTKQLASFKKPTNANKAQLYKLSKLRNVREAQKLYPNVNFLATERSKVPHLGLVDALLIARYGLYHLC